MEGPSTNTISASKNSAWKVSKYGFFSGLYIGLNTGKYGPGKTPYLDIFHAVQKSPAMQARKIKIFFSTACFQVYYTQWKQALDTCLRWI